MEFHTNKVICKLKQAIREDSLHLQQCQNNPDENIEDILEYGQALQRKIDDELLPALTYLSSSLKALDADEIDLRMEDNPGPGFESLHIKPQTPIEQ